MTQTRTTTLISRKFKRAKATRKRVAASNIAQRYFELQRLREILKAESRAR
jgi:hypothetical protein